MTPTFKAILPPVEALNRQVSKRLQYFREQAGYTQKALAAALNPPLVFHQIRRYEKGTYPIPAAHLYQISQLLDVPIEQFFPILCMQDLSRLQEQLTTAQQEVLRRWSQGSC